MDDTTMGSTRFGACRDEAAVVRVLTAPRTLVAVALLYPVGIASSLFLAGMTVAPFLLGLCAFVLIFAGVGLVLFRGARAAAAERAAKAPQAEG